MKTNRLGCTVAAEQPGHDEQRQPAQEVVAEQQVAAVDAVGQPAARDRADDVEDADQREQAGARGRRHAVVVGGGDEVGADQPVGRPAADPERDEQDPERPASGRLPQHASASRAGARVGGAGRGRASSPGGAPYGGCRRRAGRSRSSQPDQRHQQQGERGDQAGRPPPARALGQLGDERQEHQLARRAGRREHADDQAAVLHEPAVGDDRAEDQGQRRRCRCRRRSPTAATAATARSSPA